MHMANGDLLTGFLAGFIGGMVVGFFIFTELGRAAAISAISKGAKVAKEKVEQWAKEEEVPTLVRVE